VEEATSVSGPDFERMSKDVVDAWFDSFEDISPLPSVVGPVSDAVACPASGADGVARPHGCAARSAIRRHS
jgi:hypothetical protein